MLIVSFFCAASKEEKHVVEYAKMEATANFNKDIALRRWVAKRGGVYVEISEETPPNPYLKHIPERDISTSSGKKLTLMNPAYMLRQTMNDFSKSYGVRGRITSLKPLNPINTPDPWEVKVLNQFEQGAKTVLEVTTIEGKPYLRYMQVFYIKKGCLKCHAHQGYKVNDVRGGVGVSIPLEPYIALKNDTVRMLLCFHATIWLMGILCILYIRRYTRKQILYQSEIETDLVSQKERLDLVLEGTQLGLWDWNPVTNQVIFDDRWAEILGYELSEITFTLHSWESKIHPNDLPFYRREMQRHINGTTDCYEDVYRMKHKKGHWIYILDRGKIVARDVNNNPARFAGTHTDITKLKEIENALSVKSKELERVNVILSQQAMYDGLTQVNNRRAFDKRIKEEWQRWLRNSFEFSILIADIDYFKKYNDTYGHVSGDNCLKQVAQELNKTATRANDFIARYGGEEFVIILPGIQLAEAMKTAEQARNVVASLAIPHLSSDCSDVVTISIGAAASGQISNPVDYTSLVSLADKALYLAKKNGRNRMEHL